jgi:outer membrane protein TolC
MTALLLGLAFLGRPVGAAEEAPPNAPSVSAAAIQDSSDGPAAGPSAGAPPALTQAAPVLTLQEATARALEQNHTLKAAGYDAEAAGHRVALAETAYNPTLDISSDLSHSGSTSTLDGATLVSDRDSLGMSAGGRLTLFDATRGPSVESAKQSEAAAQSQLEQTAQDLIFDVRSAYFQLLLDEQLVAISGQQVENVAQRVEQAQGFYDAGTVALSEVKQAQADLAQARLELTRAETTLELDWIELNKQMGEPGTSTYALVQEPVREAPAASLESLVAYALDHRPELQAGWARVRAQLARVDAVLADRLPRLSLSAGYGLNGQPSPLDQSWNAGLALSWSFYDGGATAASAAEAKASAESLGEQVRQQSDTVHQEVASALATWRQARIQAQTAAVGVEAAAEGRRLAAERYRVGVGSALELSDAELALTLARAESARADYAARSAEAQLALAVGSPTLDLASLENTTL